jgi:hypothetical protein
VADFAAHDHDFDAGGIGWGGGFELRRELLDEVEVEFGIFEGHDETAGGHSVAEAGGEGVEGTLADDGAAGFFAISVIGGVGFPENGAGFQ